MFSTSALLQPITLFILFGEITADFEFVATSGVVTRLDGERNVVLPCGVTADPELVQFQWTLQNYVVHDDGRRSQVGSNLHFSRLVRNLDTGEFRCVVTELETGLSRTSPPIRINFIWLSDKAEVRVVKPKGGEVVRGQEVILECEVEGSVEIKFKWHRNGEVQTGSGKKLNLGGVGVESSGSYKCDASSDAGKVSSPFFHLLIPDDDDNMQDFVLPSSQVVPVNTPVTINCILGQTPLQWIFQETLVQNSSRSAFHPFFVAFLTSGHFSVQK